MTTAPLSSACTLRPGTFMRTSSCSQTRVSNSGTAIAIFEHRKYGTRDFTCKNGVQYLPSSAYQPKIMTKENFSFLKMKLLTVCGYIGN